MQKGADTSRDPQEGYMRYELPSATADGLALDLLFFDGFLLPHPRHMPPLVSTATQHPCKCLWL